MRGRAWLRVGCGAVLFILLSACQLADMARFSYANARSTHHWEPGAHSTTVPFELIDNHIVLPVSVNGSETLRFVLDSGAAATVIIESRDTSALSLRLGGRLTVSGVGTGPDPVANIVENVDITVGDVQLQGLSVIYLPLSSIPFFSDYDEVYFDGVIGAPFFRRFLVAVDYEQQLLTFSEPLSGDTGVAATDRPWQMLPLEIDAGTPYLKTSLTAGEGELVTVKLLVDTGARGTVSLTPDTDESLKVPPQYYSTVSQGLSGDVKSRVAMSDSLWLGDFHLQQLPVSYAQGGGESENGSNGILGNEVLRRFHVIFDYPGERLWIAPNSEFAVPIRMDRSGLRVRPHKSGGIVKRVAPGSAGDAAGIKSGDIITSFGDTAVTAKTINSLRQALASDSKALHLCWEANEQNSCEELQLASRLGRDSG